jgi:hypothetical protein
MYSGAKKSRDSRVIFSSTTSPSPIVAFAGTFNLSKLLFRPGTFISKKIL